MLLILDNYDSFTYNLVQYAGELGVPLEVRRNDTLTVEEALALRPSALLVSPGPCTPSEAGISVPLIRAAGEAGIPTFGVCLGHQAIGEAFGATVVRADRLMHGKTTEVVHTGEGIFSGVPSPVTVMRYHSLVIKPETVPPELEVTAWSADRPAGTEIMAVRHRRLPVVGVQFHPESVGTEHGRVMVRNFVQAARRQGGRTAV